MTPSASVFGNNADRVAGGSDVNPRFAVNLSLNLLDEFPLVRFLAYIDVRFTDRVKRMNNDLPNHPAFREFDAIGTGNRPECGS